MELIESVIELGATGVSMKTGISLVPIQVRLNQDKLIFVLKILQISPEKYKDSKKLLTLLKKLGTNDEESQTKGFFF